MFSFHFKNCNEFNLLANFSFIVNFASSTIPSKNWNPIQYGRYSLGNSIAIYDNDGTRKVESKKVQAEEYYWGAFLSGLGLMGFFTNHPVLLMGILRKR